MAWSRSASLSSRNAEINCSMRSTCVSSLIVLRSSLNHRLFPVECRKFVGNQPGIIRHQSVPVGPESLEKLSVRSQNIHILHFGERLHGIDPERTDGDRKS